MAHPLLRILRVGQGEQTPELFYLPPRYVFSRDPLFFRLPQGDIASLDALIDLGQILGFADVQSLFQLSQHGVPRSQPFSFPDFPLLLLGFEDQLRYIASAWAAGAYAQIICSKRGVGGFVGMVERELRLSQIVVGFHVRREEIDSLEAIVDTSIPCL